MPNAGWFRRIFWEPVDVHIDGVYTYPTALSAHYMVGREAQFLAVGCGMNVVHRFAYSAVAPAKVKRRVSRGVEHGALLLAGCPDRELGREALPGAGGMGYVEGVTCTTAWCAGKRGGTTAHTDEAHELAAFLDGLDEDGPIQHRMIDALEYYGELSKYKFLIAPRGNSIQSPKMMEALLVRQKGCAHACPGRAPLRQWGLCLDSAY
eukprot:scaffold357_cov400-Prasinococcus_capsulatus_cf.AAC.3